MKLLLSSKRYHYIARVNIFLLVITLIVGIVGCGPVQYTLTISSTTGGNVTTPGEGTFTYNEGTVVNLVVEAEIGERNYKFVEWTGDVSTITDVSATATTITVNGNYYITANFVPDGWKAIWDWYDLDGIRDNLGGRYCLMNDLGSASYGY